MWPFKKQPKPITLHDISRLITRYLRQNYAGMIGGHIDGLEPMRLRMTLERPYCGKNGCDEACDPYESIVEPFLNYAKDIGPNNSELVNCIGTVEVFVQFLRDVLKDSESSRLWEPSEILRQAISQKGPLNRPIGIIQKINDDGTVLVRIGDG